MDCSGHTSLPTGCAGPSIVRTTSISLFHRRSPDHALGPFGSDSDLRRHGEKIASRGGKNAKKRAAVAVARKLSVLLHRLWVTAEVYDPLYNTRRQAEVAA